MFGKVTYRGVDERIFRSRKILPLYWYINVILLNNFDINELHKIDDFINSFFRTGNVTDKETEKFPLIHIANPNM